ncbi:MAG TPA: tRNA (5-methylaminomethyl-2-thiouridine)(34)-methyltransferase MnmD [Mucilaginibacter sp.]|nr:tRNA (5-methylaminomethyl-2-thiouridine)(34)-methyltransferase MnmD [Mucilaginibacter sp.]
MPDNLTIISTADGSNTIYNSRVGENYHSRHGALQESRHVFLNSGLKYFLETAPSKSPPAGETLIKAVSVLEVGFGTGLNFLLSAQYCSENDIRLNYTGIEAYPLSEDLIFQTGYDKFVSVQIWDSFRAQYLNSLNGPVDISPYCKLHTAHCKLLDFKTEEQFDVIYFDAFASVRQPEMWNEKAIAHTVGFLKPGGVFVTYAITGNLKRIIKGLGLKVEKAPGAPGKREMLRATRSINIQM